MTARRKKPQAPPRKRILLVDDHALLRRGLRTLIETEPDLMVCAEASTRQAGLDAIATAKPDLVIADLSLKDSDGLEMIKDLKQRFPHLPVLACSMHDEAAYAGRVLRAGARGYLSKQEADDIVVLTAIRRVLAGEIHTSEAMARHLARKYVDGRKLEQGSSVEFLSDRELQVFELIGRGKATREIAEFLCLSVKTIESYREHLKVKLKFASGRELTHGAMRWAETGRLG